MAVKPGHSHYFDKPVGSIGICSGSETAYLLPEQDPNYVLLSAPQPIKSIKRLVLFPNSQFGFADSFKEKFD